MNHRIRCALNLAMYTTLTVSFAAWGDEDDAPPAGTQPTMPTLNAEQQRAVGLRITHPVPAKAPERIEASVPCSTTLLLADDSAVAVAAAQEHAASSELARLTSYTKPARARRSRCSKRLRPRTRRPAPMPAWPRRASPCTGDPGRASRRSPTQVIGRGGIRTCGAGARRPAGQTHLGCVAVQGDARRGRNSGTRDASSVRCEQPERTAERGPLDRSAQSARGPFARRANAVDVAGRRRAGFLSAARRPPLRRGRGLRLQADCPRRRPQRRRATYPSR